MIVLLVSQPDTMSASQADTKSGDQADSVSEVTGHRVRTLTSKNNHQSESLSTRRQAIARDAFGAGATRQGAIGFTCPLCAAAPSNPCQGVRGPRASVHAERLALAAGQSSQRQHRLAGDGEQGAPSGPTGRVAVSREQEPALYEACSKNTNHNPEVVNKRGCWFFDRALVERLRTEADAGTQGAGQKSKGPVLQTPVPSLFS